MNFTEIMNLVAGLFQFAAAAYALRLNRLFGTTRVGWSLFSAFFLLALLHLMPLVLPVGVGVELAIKMEVVYALISLLLLTGMVHIETLLKEHLRREREEQRVRAELELEVQKKTAYLMRAIQELQSEIDERKRMETEVETTHLELRAVSRKAELAQVTASVLRSVGNMLKSVNVTANLVSDQMKQSKIANVVNVGALIRSHAADLGKFMTQDPRGQKLPVYIAQLAEHLTDERLVLTAELESLRKNLEHIKEILAMHQKCANLASLNDTMTVTNSFEGPRHLCAVAVA